MAAENLVDYVEEAARSGCEEQRQEAERLVRQSIWAMETEEPTPVGTLIESMLDTAKKGPVDRFFVATAARRLGIHISAQLGEEAFAESKETFAEGTDDVYAIRAFGCILNKVLTQPDTQATGANDSEADALARVRHIIARDVASLSILSVRAIVAGRNMD